MPFLFTGCRAFPISLVWYDPLYSLRPFGLKAEDPLVGTHGILDPDLDILGFGSCTVFAAFVEGTELYLGRCQWCRYGFEWSRDARRDS